MIVQSMLFYGQLDFGTSSARVDADDISEFQMAIG